MLRSKAQLVAVGPVRDIEDWHSRKEHEVHAEKTGLTLGFYGERRTVGASLAAAFNATPGPRARLEGR
jgi:hypothetical protein